MKLIICKNEQKPELAPCFTKRELLSRSYTHENQELRSWNHVREKMSSGTVSF